MKQKKDDRIEGFTLIEILVALTIIGVLLTFVAPVVLNRPDQARALKIQNDFVAIETALNLFRLDNGRFPNKNKSLHFAGTIFSRKNECLHFADTGFSRKNKCLHFADTGFSQEQQVFAFCGYVWLAALVAGWGSLSR